MGCLPDLPGLPALRLPRRVMSDGVAHRLRGLDLQPEAGESLQPELTSAVHGTSIPGGP